MRVSDKLLYNTVTNNLQQNLEKMLKIQEKVSSGRRINHPSDDPIGVMKVMDYNTAISRAEQYQRNIDNGNAILSATESAISTTQDILLRAKELSLAALNGTNSAADRNITAQEIETLYQETLQIANTRFDGRYLFGGYNTSTPPYNSDGTYAGTEDPYGYIEMEIGSGATVAINMPGYRVFGTPAYGVDILGTLINLRTALENNDSQGINDAMEDLDSGMDQVDNIQAEIGAKMNRLDTAKYHLDKLKLDLLGYKSETEDADITQVITDLAMQESVLELSRASTARILDQSLLDFLR